MLNPTIFEIWSIQVTWYALVYICGFLTALFILIRASNKKELDITKSQAYDIIIILFLGAIAGARIFHILFYSFDYFSSNPDKILKIWEGGLSFHGGVIGAFLAVFIYCKKKKINFWKLADILALPLIFFLALGRLANFINQEIVGEITNVPWCVHFIGWEGCRHPVQLYGAFGRFVLFVFLLFLQEQKKFKDGFIFWIFVLLISIGRFFTDFFRVDALHFGLSSGQWLSLFFIIMSIISFKLTTKQPKSSNGYT